MAARRRADGRRGRPMGAQRRLAEPPPLIDEPHHHTPHTPPLPLDPGSRGGSARFDKKMDSEARSGERACAAAVRQSGFS